MRSTLRAVPATVPDPFLNPPLPVRTLIVDEIMQKTRVKAQAEKQSDEVAPREATSSDCEAAPPPESTEINMRAPASQLESLGKRRSTGGLSCIMRSVPTAIVLLLLGGIGYLGHQTGWKIPEFSTLVGNGPSENEDWCAEHGVPESECVACNADLMPKGKLHGWCKEHGVHECVLHHPDVAQLKETPEISPADLDRAARAIAMRPRTKNDPACKMHLRRVQFPSSSAVDKAGIDINLVDRGRVVESISATGQIVYDSTRMARLSSRAAGTVWRVETSVGDQVKEGEVLAIVDAAEVGRAKAELLRTVAQLDLRIKNYERLTELNGIVPGRRALEAETANTEAEVAVRRAIHTLANLGMNIAYETVHSTSADELRRKVQLLGLPPDTIQHLHPTQTTSNLIPVFAPRDGIIVTRDVVAGEVTDTAKVLFTIADTSLMWLMLNVPLEEAKHVAIGQKVAFHPDGGDETAIGPITWISTDVDSKTRTVVVRAELFNHDGHLRNETFGRGKTVLRDEPEAIIVPSTAVHWEGCCHVVFVRDKDFMTKGSYKVFHTRSVRPGVNMGDYTEMIAGLWPGEVVVTKGSGVLRAELLKGNLGAG